MSRVAKKPVEMPSGVSLTVSGQTITAKGPKGVMSMTVNNNVSFAHEDNVLTFKPANDLLSNMAMAGTMRSLANNLVVGVSKGFEKKLNLVGVGYRGQATAKVLNLSLGFSFACPDSSADTCHCESVFLRVGSNRARTLQSFPSVGASSDYGSSRNKD